MSDVKSALDEIFRRSALIRHHVYHNDDPAEILHRCDEIQDALMTLYALTKPGAVAGEAVSDDGKPEVGLAALVEAYTGNGIPPARWIFLEGVWYHRLWDGSYVEMVPPWERLEEPT